MFPIYYNISLSLLVIANLYLLTMLLYFFLISLILHSVFINSPYLTKFLHFSSLMFGIFHIFDFVYFVAFYFFPFHT